MKPPFNILLPVKNLRECKQRLSPVLTLQERQYMVMRLLEKNLRVLINDFVEHNLLVITPDKTVAALAKKLNVHVLLEPVAQGLNEAVEAGTRWSLKEGYHTQVVLAPDIAQLEIDELQQFLGQTQAQTQASSIVTIAVANDGGTNALLTRPPNAIPFQYGPLSSLRMQRDSQQRGIDCHLMHLPCMSLDIDTPQDLARWEIIDQQHMERMKQCTDQYAEQHTEKQWVYA